MTALTTADDWMFGIQLPIQTLTRTLVDPWEDEATVADLVAIARAADQHRFDFVGVCDHVAIPDNDYAARMTTTWYDTISTLSFLAAHTEHTRLLSVVWIAAYRHPLVTAKAFGTLDHLSNGRAILGVGAGHVEAEFEALGVDFGSRGRQLDETLDAVRVRSPTPTSATRASTSPMPMSGWLHSPFRTNSRSGSVGQESLHGVAPGGSAMGISRWGCRRRSTPLRSR